ncbi:DUF456 domain-containing protein, partial [bacterium]|nr:DUF456 domain-containing protein [bacterium]
MIVLEILGILIFWLVMFVGVALIPFGIPGTFLILVNVLVYGWLTDFVDITWGFLGFLFFIAILAEAIEFFLGAAAAGRYGASKFAMLGAVIGGFVGAIWATSIFPLVGTLLGAFLGAFGGAALFEYITSKDVEKSVKAGWGAFL